MGLGLHFEVGFKGNREKELGWEHFRAFPERVCTKHFRLSTVLDDGDARMSTTDRIPAYVHTTFSRPQEKPCEGLTKHWPVYLQGCSKIRTLLLFRKSSHFWRKIPQSIITIQVGFTKGAFGTKHEQNGIEMMG